jgi:hypothetical protein
MSPRLTKAQLGVSAGLGLVLLLYLNPNNGISLPLASIANILVLFVGFGAGLREWEQIAKCPIPIGLFALVGLVGSASVFGSESNAGDILYGIRVLALTPIAMALCGFALAQMGPLGISFALIPSAVGGVILMTWAMTLPFTGEFMPGMFVWENDRIFLHPLSNAPMWPVSLSENCSVAFVLFFFTFAGLKKWQLGLTIPIAIVAAAISVSSATRTYIYSQFAVFGLIIIRKLFLEKRYRDIGVGLISLMMGFAGLYLYEPLRLATLDRLDRFGSGEGAFGTSGRIDIWVERYPMALQSGFLSGLGITSYGEKFELSSHNVLLDYWLMGGGLYIIVQVLVLACILYVVTKRFLSPSTNQFEIAVIGSFVMMSIVTLVSSPIISSPIAHVLYWLLGGAVLGCGVRKKGSESNARVKGSSYVAAEGKPVIGIGGRFA